MSAILVLLAAGEFEPAQRRVDYPRSAQLPEEVHHVEVHRSRPRRVGSHKMESFAGFGQDSPVSAAAVSRSSARQQHH